MMLKRFERRRSWTDWDESEMWSVLVMIIIILSGCLLFIPILTIVLEDPSLRFMALVLAFGTMSLLILVLTMPKSDRRTWSTPEIDEKEEWNARAIVKAANDSREGMIASLMELRSVMLERLRIRRRLDDEELRSLIRSPMELQKLLDEELLEELLLEDPRFLAWKMDRNGEFLDRYEELLLKVEVWT